MEVLNVFLGLFLVFNSGLILQWIKRPGLATDVFYEITLTISLKKLFWLSDINAAQSSSQFADTGCSYKADTFTGSRLTLIHDTFSDNYGFILILGI